MKILNLDKLDVTPTRFLTIGGIDHPIAPMTVENFIETTNAVEMIQKNDASPVEQVKATVDMICRTVPSLARSAIEGKSLAALRTIADFVRGDDVDEQEEKEGLAGE